MSIFAKLFVGVVFTILGLSFVATTAVLYYEFGTPELGDTWWKIATFYSHLFIFFPTFGIVALVAFFIPASAFVDMYWRHVPLGVMRFVIGLVLVVIASLHISEIVAKGDLRSMWEVKPEVLIADAGTPAGCLTDQQSCVRVPVFAALKDVWQKSSQRLGMARFVRDCKPDPLIEAPPEQTALRYCFAMQEKVDAPTCCQAQKSFGRALSMMHLEPGNRSLTESVHKALLPLKVFFLLVILVIALLLIFWRHSLPRNYPNRIEKIQRGVLVGALMMMFLPLMNMAFLQSSGLVYGTELDSNYRSISPYLVGTTLGWSLLILFFFFHETDKNERDLEQFARIGGLVGSGVFALNYNLVVDYFTRFMGSGMGIESVVAIAVFCLSALAVILMQPKRVIPAMTKRPPGEPVGPAGGATSS
ncbi:MAG: hypothetical protein AAFV45_04320 [Pseudomonadota bacterium]